MAPPWRAHLEFSPAEIASAPPSPSLRLAHRLKPCPKPSPERLSSRAPTSTAATLRRRPCSRPPLPARSAPIDSPPLSEPLGHLLVAGNLAVGEFSPVSAAPPSV